MAFVAPQSCLDRWSAMPQLDSFRNTPQLHNEDCLKTMAGMEDNSVDLIVTDPPYGTTDLKFDRTETEIRKIFHELKRIMKPAGWCFVFYPPAKIHGILECGFRSKFEYVWLKPNLTLKSHNTIRPYLKHELIFALFDDALKKPTSLYFDSLPLRTEGEPYHRTSSIRKGTEYEQAHRFHNVNSTITNDGYREGTSILEFPAKNCMKKAERTSHPTQKPQALVEMLCRAYCPPGGKIYDPFAGSGTVPAAAIATDRKATASEISKEYFDIMKERLEKLNSTGRAQQT